MTEEALFDLVLNTPDAERAALLDRLCGDPALRARVEALLRADATTDLTRPHPVARAGDATASYSPPIGTAGVVVGGKYKLVEPIGEGGMGSVWLAHQTEPVKRKVAVKLIKAGMDSKAVIARFEAERQALAVMDHPNIAKILDGGLHDGRPYFVMELVKGVPITDFCDKRKLTPRQRLELFVPVCQAIQHAHQKGIIHRDIKPNNVLVALYDDRPVPKVIDFGLAKATGGGLTDLSVHTGFGGVVGTPQYMSPEQASLNNLDIDTRSDIYSLGVLLYELLAGSPPFRSDELQRAGLMEMLRVVREDAPPKPSTKLSTADARASICAARGVEPAKLAGLLKGELDWVVMKALEKDRARRYDTANGFAADVSRYLDGEAVQAHPPSVAYRLRKAVRKHRGPVLAGALVAATLVLGMVGTTLGLVRAEREADRARAEEQKVRDEQTRTQAARDAAELNLVHSFLRPIGYNTEKLDQAELVALDELARHDDDRIKLLFLREALADGPRALRIARRVDRVVQAAVGPSLKRRASALALCTQAQRDPAADPRVKLAACWIAIELADDAVPALKEHFDTLLSQRNLTDHKNYLNQLSIRLHPKHRKVLFEALLGLIVETTDRDVLRIVCDTLGSFGTQLEPGDANRLLARLLGVLGKVNDGEGSSLSDLLKLLVPRVGVGEVTRSFDALVAVLGRTTDHRTLMHASHGLRALAPALDAGDAARGFNTLLALFGSATDKNTLEAVGVGLEALAPQLDASNATRGFDALLAVFGKFKHHEHLRAAGNGLAALAPRLDPNDAKRGFDALLGVLGKTADSGTQQAAVRGLAALAPRLDLDPNDAKRGFDALLGVLGKTADYPTQRAAVRGLAALAPRLDPNDAKRGFDALLGLYSSAKSTDAMLEAVTVLKVLNPRISASDAKRGCETLLGVLGVTPDHRTRLAAARGVVALAPRLDAAEIKHAFESLLAVFCKTTSTARLGAADEVLAALVPRLSEVEINQAFDTAITTYRKLKTSELDDHNFHMLTALVPRLNTVQIGQTCDWVIPNVIKTEDINNDYNVAGVALLDAIIPRLSVHYSQQMADSLEVMNENTGTNVFVRERMVQLLPQLPEGQRTRRLHRVLREDFRGFRTWPPYSNENWSLLSAVARVDSLAFLVELLTDPGCNADTQTVLLRRIEELAYPDPAVAAISVGLAADPLARLTLPALSIVAENKFQRTRRFRTVTDAAQWIAAHHPEIDLERPYTQYEGAK